MRIIGEFDLQDIKVTVFKMNEKISVKFEYNLMEQTFKLRDGSGIEKYDDVLKMCEGNTHNNIMEIFSQMAQWRTTRLMTINNVSEDEFDEIV